MKRKTRKKILIWSYVALAAIILFLIISIVQLRGVVHQYDTAYGALQGLSGIGNYGTVHNHADFAVNINGQEFDFDKIEYQDLHPWTHVHSGTNNVHLIHAHAEGITYGQFFDTIGIDLGDCLIVNEKEFCDKNGRLVKYYLNGKLTPDLQYQPVEDSDRVLIAYGSENGAEIQSQLDSVGERACIQSDKC